MIYNSGYPIKYDASDFIAVYSYEPDLQRKFKDWHYSRDLEAPDDLSVTLVDTAVIYTVAVVATFISNRETVDLIKVTTDKEDDTPSFYITTSSGRSRNFGRDNSSQVIDFSEVKAPVANTIVFKTKQGEFLYFNIPIITEAYTLATS
ncbi:hypothetical protein AU106_gp005 [Sinorhizobium phage phiM9]|uniref:Uncharacterized protein n=1 Tax=Sinorhizobium phage phiM9 TaxID=1636182 RepID=A0A0F6TGG5_9CAUD|nr:hypothetical protein AU106_gp005 [Sinorhizobium phage phiM9]AKE44636.1 hypothetical protein Sm_phiM9_006 [Sinorhizobium phage phiM9]